MEHKRFVSEWSAEDPPHLDMYFGQGSYSPRSTYIYRVQSSVWRLPTIDPPPLLHLANVSCPRTRGREVHTRRGRWGVGGSIFRKTPDIGLASYSVIPLRYSHSLQTFLCLLYIMLQTYPYSFVLQIYIYSITLCLVFIQWVKTMLLLTLYDKIMKVSTWTFCWDTLKRKSHLCIPFLGIAWPQSQFLHSCVCWRFIHSQDHSTYCISCSRLGKSMVGIYESLTDTLMWKLGLWSRNSFSGNICFQFLLLVICNAWLPSIKIMRIVICIDIFALSCYYLFLLQSTAKSPTHEEKVYFI